MAYIVTEADSAKPEQTISRRMAEGRQMLLPPGWEAIYAVAGRVLELDGNLDKLQPQLLIPDVRMEIPGYQGAGAIRPGFESAH